MVVSPRLKPLEATRPREQEFSESSQTTIVFGVRSFCGVAQPSRCLAHLRCVMVSNGVTSSPHFSEQCRGRAHEHETESDAFAPMAMPAPSCVAAIPKENLLKAVRVRVVRVVPTVTVGAARASSAASERERE